MRKPRLLSIVVALFSLVIASTASAQLVLNIDTSSQTLWFTGSDTGQPATDVGTYSVAWNNGGSTTTNEFDTITGAISTSAGSINYGPQFQLSTTDSRVAFTLGIDSSSSATLSGTSTTFDYSTWDSNGVSNLEALVGSQLSLGGGTGFSSISVVAASAVPEPSTYAAIFGVFALASTMIIRRRPRIAAAV